MRRTPLLIPILLLALSACFSAEAPERRQSAAHVTATCAALGGTFSGVEFNDDQGSYVVALANQATAETLQQIDGVGPRIAERIIASRPFTAITNLDAVAFVGAKILQGLRDHADRRVVLAWANTASRSELTAVCRIGDATARAIEAARPMNSVDDLLAVRNIGEQTLKTLLGVEGFTCATKGSVIEEWCGEGGAACWCSAQGQEPTGFVIDEDSATNWAEEAAGSWYGDNADYAWEEYCQVSYDHNLPYAEIDVINFCDRFFIERFVQASMAGSLALVGNSYADEDAGQQAVTALVKDIFSAPTWMGDFEAELIAYLGTP